MAEFGPLQPKPITMPTVAPKEIPLEPKPLPKTTPQNKVLSRDSFKEKFLKAKQEGYTMDEVLKTYKKMGYTIEGINYDDFITPEPTPQPQQPSTAQNIAGGLVQSATALPELAVMGAEAIAKNDPLLKTVKNIASTTGIGKKAVNFLSSKAQQVADIAKQKLSTAGVEITGADPESKAYQGAKLAGDIVQTVALPGPGGVTKGAGLLKGAGQLAKQGAIETAKFTAISDKRLPTPTELAIGTVGNVAIGGAIKGLGAISKSVIDKSPQRAAKMLTNMNRITKGEQEKFAQQQGKTVGQFLNEKGIVSGGEKTISSLAKGFQDSISKADDGLAAIKGNYKDPTLSLMGKEAAEFAENTLSPEAQKIRALAAKADDVGLTMPEVNDLKRFYERNNKFTYGKDITAGEKTIRATNIDNAVRERQFDIAAQNGFENLRQINKETQAYKFLLNKLIKNESGRLGNDAMGLTDWIVAGQIATDPSAIALLVGKKVASSPWFRSGIVKILNKLGKIQNPADQVVEMAKIQQIQDEKALNKYLSLPYKKNVVTPTLNLNSPSGNQGAIKGTNVSLQPKPTVKTPPIVRETGFAQRPQSSKIIPKATPSATSKEVVPLKKDMSFERMAQLDTEPNYKKLSLADTNYKRNVKGLETEYGTVESIKFDNKYVPQEFTIDGIKYPADKVNSFYQKMSADELSKTATINKNAEIRKKLQAIRNGKENKVSGPQLRIIMEDLGIKSVNDIPDDALQTVLDMARTRVASNKKTPKFTKNTTNAPSVGKVKVPLKNKKK